jgi:hypothetical protein
MTFSVPLGGAALRITHRVGFAGTAHEAAADRVAAASIELED